MKRCAENPAEGLKLTQAMTTWACAGLVEGLLKTNPDREDLPNMIRMAAMLLHEDVARLAAFGETMGKQMNTDEMLKEMGTSAEELRSKVEKMLLDQIEFDDKDMN